MQDENAGSSSATEVEVTEQNAESSEPQETEKTDAEPQVEEATASDKESESDKGESVSSPEEAKQSARSNAESRIKQLTAKIRTMERNMAALQQQPPQPHPSIPEPKRPTLDAFERVEDFNAAMDKYDIEARKYAAEKAIIERDARQKQEAEQKTINDAISAFNKRAERLIKENPDFNVGEYRTAIDPNPTTDGFLLDSDVGPELLSHLYENPEEADRIRALPPFKAARELTKLELKISDQMKGIKKPAPVKPPNYVTGQAASPLKEKAAWDVLYS